MTRDVSAIVEAFTHEELAHIVARIVQQMPDGLNVSTPTIVGYGPDIIATVTQSGPSAVTIKVHEPERDSGYYLVYDATYCQDAVYFWDRIQGHWRSTDHEDSMRRTGQMHVQHWVGPAIEKKAAEPQLPDGTPYITATNPNWTPKRLCGCDTPDPAIGGQESVPADAWLLCKTCRGYFGGPQAGPR